MDLGIKKLLLKEMMKILIDRGAKTVEDIELKAQDEIAKKNEYKQLRPYHAIILAKNNIRKFHEAQDQELPCVETMSGVRCWQKAKAIEKVGLYIPGGTAPLFSTVLMLAIPAKIAGCKEIVLCTPPNREGKVHPAVLYAAKMAGSHAEGCHDEDISGCGGLQLLQ